jgi:S-adenosylmethionine:tRNA ribosyltransferase-isomerase
MRLDAFDYPLDESLIAQQPIDPRDEARLLVLDRRTGDIRHQRVAALPELLAAGDSLIFNDTLVFPARFLGTKRPSGGKIELLLVRRIASSGSGVGQNEVWTALIRGHAHAGQQVELPEGVLVSIIDSQQGTHVVSFPPGTDVAAYAEKSGLVPLPPYIRRPPSEHDRRCYQTIFARHPGAVAAPTAGLHFTQRLLDRLTRADISMAQVTLHVGPGTFRPVTTPDIRDHQMDSEWYDLPAVTAATVQATKARNRRVVAVGTTSVRVLETAGASLARLRAESGETSLFIYPGYDFKVVDALLTNFHLPKSTLFMLVCALAGRELMLETYRIAVAERYRFYSYGDAMLIL